jgi:hypothetical protein
MAIKFIENGHQYLSIDTDEIKWKSVTGIISKFKEPFNAKEQSVKSSANKKSPWYGIPPDEICQRWLKEGSDSTFLGSWYHNQRETDLTEFETIERRGIQVPIVKPIITDGIKYAPDQKLKNGVYPEHMMYLKSGGICGQSDRVEVINGIVDISDYKTNKDLKLEPYVSWDGKMKKMLDPISHLGDCDIVHYGLQLSMYMYMIIKHNPLFKPGKLTIEHIVFEEESRDKFNSRILRRDEQGNPIVKEVVPYEVPYYKTEIINIINYLRS